MEAGEIYRFHLDASELGAARIFITTPEQGEGSAPDWFSIGSTIFRFSCEQDSADESKRNLVVRPSDFFLKREHVQVIQWKLSRELSSTRYAICTIGAQRQRAQEGHTYDHWLRLTVGLLQRLETWKVRLDLGRLQHILGLAETDIKKAYQLLASAFQHALAQREARLQRHLHILAQLMAAFYSFLRISYSVRNLIASQRSWFLHHGAHPSDTLALSAQGCFSRACFQPA